MSLGSKALLSIIAIGAVLGFYGKAHATAGTTFTFNQMVSVAFSRNLDLQIQKQENQGEGAQESVAFTSLLPSLSLSSGRSQTLHDSVDPDDEDTSYSSTLSVSQAVYQPALWANWRKSQLRKTRSDQSLEKQRQSLLYQLKQAWYNLLKEQILYKEAMNSLERLKLHRKNAEEFYKAGKIWRNDVLQAHVRVSRGEQDVFAAQNRVELAKSRINVLMNRPITAPFVPKGQMERVSFTQPFNTLLKQALINRLELKQSEIDMELAQQDVDIARSKLWPTVNLSLSSGVSSRQSDYDPAAVETRVSLNMSWNIWQWGQTNKEIDSAELDLSVEKLRGQQQKVTIMSEVQAAFLTVMEAQKSLNVSEQALKQAEENFRVSQIRYKEQLGSSNDVLDAQDLLTSTKTTRVSALSRYLTALAELDLAVGAEVKY